MVSSRKDKSISKEADSKKSLQVLVLGAAVEVSYALNHLERSTEMSVVGRLVRTEDLGAHLWAPPPAPLLRALLHLLRALSLLRSTALPTHSGHAHTACSEVVIKSPTLV